MPEDSAPAPRHPVTTGAKQGSPAVKAATGKWQLPGAEELQAMLPQYEIARLLGRGGMGAVYHGTQRNLKRPVAIKILPPGLDEEAEDANYAERFKNEARAMAMLSHPGIVSVYASGETEGGLLYIVMEFIKGTDVSNLIARHGGRLKPAQALDITTHVCDALQYAHDNGIIHRDIKPANIMVSHDGVVKVADFGLAKMDKAGESGLTRSGMAMGTLHYMAPEALILGSKVDHRADIYAVGVMLYQMLTGRLPQGLFDPPSEQIAGLDPRFDAVILKALHNDRALRYQSAVQMRKDLDRISTRPAAATTPTAENLRSESAPPPVAESEPEITRGELHLPLLLWAAIFVLGGIIASLLWDHFRQPPALTASAVDSAHHPQANAPKTPVSGVAPAAPPASTANSVAPLLSVPAAAAANRIPELSGANTEPPPTTIPSPAMTTPVVTPPPVVSTLTAKAAPQAVDLRSAADFTNSLGMKFVRVPGTPIFMCIHETRKKDYAAYASTKSPGWSPFDNVRYNQLPVSFTPDHPVVMVDWAAAKAFCEWLSSKEQRHYRLPTDHEWSVAAGLGGREPSGASPASLNGNITRLFPWGTTWPPPQGAGNFAVRDLDDEHATTAPVMSFQPNSLGIYDLSGNVWELCEGLYDNGSDERAARGGSWRVTLPELLLSSSRLQVPPDSSMKDLGFRCVLEQSGLISDVSTAPPMPAVAATVQKTPAKVQVLTPLLKRISFPFTTDAQSLEVYVKALLDYNPYQNNRLDDYGEMERLSLLREAARINFDAVLRAVERCDNRSTIPAHEAIITIVFQHAEEANKASILRAYELHYALAPVISNKNWIQSASASTATALSNYTYLTGHGGTEAKFFCLCFQSESEAVWRNLELLFGKPGFEAASNVFFDALPLLPREVKIREAAHLERLARVMLDASRKPAPGTPYSPHQIINRAITAAHVGCHDALDVLAHFLLTGNPEFKKEQGLAMQRRAGETLRKVTGCSNSYSYLDVGKWVKYRIHSFTWDSSQDRFITETLKKP